MGDGVCSRAAGLWRTRIVLDAMGGDHAPAEPVKGAVDAVNARSDIQVLLVGQEDVVREELAKVYVPRRSDSGGTCRRGDRDCRAAGECNPQEEAVIHCHWNEYGKAEGSRRICVSGKFQCDL